jgi:hypothetical protein
MVPPYLLSCILDLDLLILLTKAVLLKRFIVDLLSRRITSLISSLIEDPACLNSLSILGSIFLSSCALYRVDN